MGRLKCTINRKLLNISGVVDNEQFTRPLNIAGVSKINRNKQTYAVKKNHWVKRIVTSRLQW